jgi:hypothetical protein
MKGFWEIYVDPSTVDRYMANDLLAIPLNV